jgi:O-methyltransferase involved in polyketide biosynthesis
MNQAAPHASPSSGPIATQLGAVQETLLIPVCARATETRRPDRLFADPLSVEMVERLDYDFGRFRELGNVMRDVVVRTCLLDRLVGQFMAAHPDGQIINLGAGLDTRQQRIDNGRMHWVHLDMPDALALREHFFPREERTRLLARSMFDWEWFEQLFAVPPADTLIVAEGLFMYFEPEPIRQLILRLAERLPGSQLLFQSISRRFVGRQRSVPGVQQTAATFGWGIDHGRELEAWDRRIEFVDQWYLVDQFPQRWGRLHWYAKIPILGRELRRVMKLTQLRFRE